MLGVDLGDLHVPGGSPAYPGTPTDDSFLYPRLHSSRPETGSVDLDNTFVSPEAYGVSTPIFRRVPVIQFVEASSLSMASVSSDHSPTTAQHPPHLRLAQNTRSATTNVAKGLTPHSGPLRVVQSQQLAKGGGNNSNNNADGGGGTGGGGGG
eukprot:CAMPEP_0185789674 /NCGR_PEP_ID=MMETSP1174-20130828/152332_1 /TAXON_ID=35687 /ORGANISM="Dictyocha speculum, Strain CCMP1381" /LENGTH=151 /DNA_ID=CAMNT_0028483931 /DNA_START=18 /DNA_END=469 /DNA_ORIENTATION=+